MRINKFCNKKGVTLVETVIAVCVLAIFTAGILTALIYSQAAISGDMAEDSVSALASKEADALITMLGSADFVKKDTVLLEPGAGFISQKSPFIDTALIENSTGAVHTYLLPETGENNSVFYTLQLSLNEAKYNSEYFFDTDSSLCIINEAANTISVNTGGEAFNCKSICGWYITLRYFYNENSFFDISCFASNSQGVFFHE